MNIATMTERSAIAMQAPLRDKVALVTDSTSGIGLGIARALAAAGAAIVLNGFGKPDEIEATQQALGTDFGVPVAYSGADMSKPDSIAEMIAMTLDRFGRLDVLVNNAGIQHVAPLQAFPVAKWDAILAINLSSAFHTIRLALPSMLANKWGRIINIASAHGLVGSPYKAAYVAAKHGMLARRLDARGGDVTPWGQRAPHPRLGEEGLTCCGRSDPSAGQRRAARRSCRRCSSTSARYPWSRRRPHRPCARSARRSCWHIPRPGPRRCR